MLKTKSISINETKIVLTQLSGLDYLDYLEFLNNQTPPEMPEIPDIDLSKVHTEEEKLKAEKQLLKCSTLNNKFIFQTQCRLVAYGVYRNEEFSSLRAEALNDEHHIDLVHHHVMRNYLGSAVKTLHDDMCDLSGMLKPEDTEIDKEKEPLSQELTDPKS